MIFPTMPEGYYLLQDACAWYILKDEGAYMKRLLDHTGEEMCFDGNHHGQAQAAEYARKHKDTGLRYDQEVSIRE